MNLLRDFPKDVDDDELLFSLAYNLNQEAEIIDGHLTFDGLFLSVYLNSEIVEKIDVSNYEEFVCELQNGSSMMMGKNGEDTKFICAFTQEHFFFYAELCKILNLYKKTGEIIESTEDEVNCEKCGIPLNGSSYCSSCSKKPQVILSIVKIASRYKKHYIAMLITLIVSQCVWVFIPQMNRLIIDKYVTNKVADLPNFLTICLAIFISIIIAGICDFISMRQSFIASFNLGADLKQMVFEKAQSLSLSSISKRTSGELISRVTNDAGNIQNFLSDYGLMVFIDLILAIVITIALFVLNPTLALFVILPIPFVLILLNKLYGIMNVRFSKSWRMICRYNSIIHDILSGIRVVKSYGNEKREIKKYKQASYNLAKANMDAERTWYFTVLPTDYLLSIGSFLVLYFGGKLVLNQEMKLGELIQYTTYVAMLYSSLRWLIDIPKILADTTVSASKVLEILDEKSTITDSSTSIDLDIKGDIEFDDVTFGYNVQTSVLKDVSFSIKRGEMIGIVGYSGVGKSTLVNLILRLYDCNYGRILIDGVDVRDINQDSLRSQIGIVLQDTFLFYGTVAENIGYAKSNASFDEIINAAKIANAHDFIVQLPEGYNTRVGDKGYTLSGGERQRIAIARAILHDPRIIILDEATASLDTQTEKQIQEALGRLTKDRTTIAIAHRLSTLSKADKLLVLDKGRLVEFGSHIELLKSKGVYYKLVMAQRQTAKLKEVATK